ncbi:hypothetical protein FB451DRAFT_679249 [Mycena latifolia]|nr:hypothetical protein FB451DRAFT_679249 [Mycena latifolia]
MSRPRPKTKRNSVDAGQFTRPRNNVLISRTFGALNLEGKRVTVDPNVRMPDYLVRKRTYNFEPPDTNLEFGVTFGAIAADVEVLPFAPNTLPKRLAYEGRKSNQVHLKFGASTGNLTLRVHAAPLARIYMETSATFGQTRIYLPRTFRGPLTVFSWARRQRLSAALQRECMPVSEEGSTTLWFVGDIANDGNGDHAKVETIFGAVWIGYVGEEDEGARALGGLLAHWARSVVAVVLLCYAIYWLPGLLWKLICGFFSIVF